MSDANATPDFSNFTALAVTEETTAEYIFTEIVGMEPSLICAPATKENRPYFDAMAREAARFADQQRRRPKRRGRRQAEAIQTPEEEEEIRDRNRLLFSRHCIRGWGQAPTDAKGAKPEFSQENCYAFLKALPGFMFDGFRDWITNQWNFIPLDTLGPGDGEALGES